MRSLSTVICVLIAAFSCFGQQATVYQDHLMKPNGHVNAMVKSGNILYLAGNFTAFKWNVPYGASLDSTTSLPFAGGAHANGLVRAVVPDGAGGWYIGGNFTMVGNVSRNRLARINADGSVHAWNPNMNNEVYVLAIEGNNIYAGGNFTNAGGQARNRLAAIDKTTGLPTAWNPNANNTILELAIDGNNVYAGGYFTTIGGQTRNRIAAIDKTTAAPTSWNPNANSHVTALAVDGNTIYIAGAFSTLGGQTRNNIAAIDKSTGLPTAWNPNANTIVQTLALDGNTLYMGGTFSTVGGQTRNNLAAVDKSTGLPTVWNPNASQNVNKLVIRGNTLYAAGGFSTIGGEDRTGLAAIDLATGTATAWNPNPNGGVLNLAVAGSSIYAAGSFSSMGQQNRNRVAAIDLSTGQLTAWNPDVNSEVHAMSVGSNSVYIGGNFTTVGGTARNNIAAVETGSGLPTAWDPGANGTVYSLNLKGGFVYAGGDFNTIGGATRTFLAALDTLTGVPTSWNPSPNASVHTMLFKENTVFIGGWFTSVNGQQRGHLAAIDVTTGVATSWNPNANAQVTSLANNGNTIFAGGNFTSVGGQVQPFLASIDATTGILNPWNPNPNGTVYVIASGNNKIYVGGGFNTVGGQQRNCLAAVDALTGAVTAWNPAPNSQINTIALSADTVYIGGYFASMAGNTSRGYAMPLIDQTVVPVEIVASTDTVCSGNPVTFTATATNAGANPSYIWTNNSVAISGATSATFTTATLSNNDTIRCIVTSSDPGNYSGVSNPIVMTVNMCSPEIAGISPSPDLCKGGNVVINFNSSQMNAGNLFKVELSDASGGFSSPTVIGTMAGATGGSINATIPAGQAIGSAYRIRITSTSPAVVGPDNGLNLSINALPTPAQVAITPAGTAAFCPGGTVKLSVPNKATYTYQWTVGNNAIAGATNYSYEANEAGSYNVTITNAAGCSRTSAVKTVSQAAPPVAGISPAQPQTVCGGSGVTFTTDTGVGMTYRWRKGNNNISGATNSSYIATTAGNYSVIVTNAGGCKDTSEAVSVTNTCAPLITNTGVLTVCAGAVVSVNYVANGNTAGNVFTLQLSDATGSFAAATDIATINGTSSGNISGIIPAGAAAGNGYKLRINTTAPAATGQTSPLTLNITALLQDHLSLCAVTVDAAGKNLLIWEKPMSPDIDSFVLYRGTVAAGVYERIGAQAYSALSTFQDTDAMPDVKPYRYYVAAQNSCSETGPQEAHRTMHLTINKGKDNSTWNLVWNGYDGFEHATYQIWRGTTPAGMSLLAETEAYEYNSYTDNDAPAGTIYYRVSIADGPACNPTARTTGGMEVSSNVAGNVEALVSPDWMDMIIYPNPSEADGHILIKSSEPGKEFRVRVMDMAGRNVLSTVVSEGRSVNFGQNLSAGVYTVEASSETSRVIRKWVKK